jgi:hypothetical protein
LPASSVVMEACGSAHHWGRWLLPTATRHDSSLWSAKMRSVA